MSARWWTFVTWALVAASAVFWGLKLFVKPAPVPASTAVATNAPAARGDLTRLLGADAPPPVAAAPVEPPPDARFQLIGVVAAKPRSAAREGVALIAVDGKPAKAYRVGAAVEGQMVLKSVAALGATLGPRDGAALVNLTLQPLPPPATGTLPPATDGSGAPQAAGLPGQAGVAPRFAAGFGPGVAPNGVNAGPALPPNTNFQAQPMQQQQRRVLPPPQQQGVDAGNPGEAPGQSPGQGMQQGAPLR